MIPLIKSAFYNEEDTRRALSEFILTTSKFSFDEECKKFETNFAEYQERRYCVFFNSGSSANLALIQALLNLGRINKNDLAGFSAITWATNVMPFFQLGLKPIPVDVELDTLNVSSTLLKQVLENNKLSLMFITNALGFCDDIENIYNVCSENGVILLEDNCESLGTVYKGKKLGNYSLASTFSFYVGHHMSTIEGGAVVTDDEELAIMLKLVRAHGWDRNLNIADQKKLRMQMGVDNDFYGKYTFYNLGYNLRPSEINGFLGNNQLQYLDEILQKRNNNFLKFAEEIYKNTKKYYPLKHEQIEFVSNFAVPIVCRSREILEELIQTCKEVLEIRPIISGDITNQPFFKKYTKDSGKDFHLPNANLINKQGMYFGNNPELTEDEIAQILELFSEKV